LERKLIGVPVRPARTVCQTFQSAVVVAPENLIAGLARDAEIPAQHGHLLSIQNPRDELQPLVHLATLLPRHLCSPRKGQKCNPCLRNELSPISREGHRLCGRLRQPRRRTHGLPLDLQRSRGGGGRCDRAGRQGGTISGTGPGSDAWLPATAWKGHKLWLAARTTAMSDSRGCRTRTTYVGASGHSRRF
jgi:hypothetical protein